MSLRIGVIGTGMIGQDHIRRLTQVLPGARITAVSDIDAERARSVAALLPDARAHATGAELIADQTVDAVLIASWGGAHEPDLLAAIAAGKPTFCEKPLATTQTACRAIIAAEVAHGKRLVQVGFMRRFDPYYRALRSTLDSGAIGAPLMFHSVHRNASAPGHFTDDLLIADTAVHDIDISRWLLGTEVAAVSVLAARQNSRGRLAEPLLILLEMTDGALVDIEVSVNIGFGYDIRGEIVGETGTAALAETNPVLLKAEGAFRGAVPADWQTRFRDAYDVELREWLTAAAQGGATGPSVWDGYAATATADAGLRALRSRARALVTLIERPALYT